MLREGALVRAMKAAYKSGGYTVAEFDNVETRRYIIAGTAWLICCDAALLPRKAMGLVVEHLGTLPRDEAFRVRKGEEPQRVMQDVPIGAYCDFYGKRYKGMYKTRLTLDGLELWREQEGNELLLMEPELTDIATVTENWPAIRSENALTVDTGAEFAAIVRVDAKLHPGVEWLETNHWEK